MCSICGFPQTAGHWSDAGSLTTHDRVRARFIRAYKLNSVLRNYRLSVHDDGVSPGMQISDGRGNVVIAADLRDLWIAAGRLCGQTIDPLDPLFAGEGGSHQP